MSCKIPIGITLHRWMSTSQGDDFFYKHYFLGNLRELFELCIRYYFEEKRLQYYVYFFNMHNQCHLNLKKFLTEIDAIYDRLIFKIIDRNLNMDLNMDLNPEIQSFVKWPFYSMIFYHIHTLSKKELKRYNILKPSKSLLEDLGILELFNFKDKD
jgi:hypothetical protein